MSIGQDAWSTPPPKRRVWRRQWLIFRFFLSWLLMLGWDGLWGRSRQRQPQQADWLVQQLIALGPTFIKIGQALSTRGDLIPLAYVQALSQLQDQVPGLSAVTVVEVIETELGQPMDVLYQDFGRIPIASASLGQVHKAQLHTGEAVVIKIQRPGLERLFEIDFAILHYWVRWGDRLIPGLRKYELEARYQEFFALLYQEIDYVHEGQNADRFRVNFQANSHILVPKVYWRYSNRKVLTLEYLPGIKIDDRQRLIQQQLNPDKVIELGICCYLKQLLLDGFFQSDPHPGNMAVSDQGKLIFYDFGTMAEVQAIAKEQMVQTFFAVIRKDTDTVVQTLVYMGLIEPLPDMTPIKRLIEFILEQFTDKPLDFATFKQVQGEIYWMFQAQPFRLPAQMSFVLKSLTTLDGIARSLNPQYNLMVASRPFIKSVALSQGKGQLWSLLRQQFQQLIQKSLRRPGQMRRRLRELEARFSTSEQQHQQQLFAQQQQIRRLKYGLRSLTYASLLGFSALVVLTLPEAMMSPWRELIWAIAVLSALLLLHTLLSWFLARVTRPRS